MTAEDAVLRVLERADRALSAAEIKQAWLADGAAKEDVERDWPKVQRRLKEHEHVVVEDGRRYRFSAVSRTPAITATQALEQLAQPRLAPQKRAALITVVQAALANGDKHATVPLVRALAELAIEVEELTVNEASARAMIHRVRAQVKQVGLEPIDRAGEESTLDRSRHEPIGAPIEDGTPVVVVRPGYVWKAPAGDVLIARAVVQDRS